MLHGGCVDEGGAGRGLHHAHEDACLKAVAGDVGDIGYGAAIVEKNYIHQIASDFIAGVGTPVDLEL